MQMRSKPFKMYHPLLQLFPIKHFRWLAEINVQLMIYTKASPVKTYTCQRAPRLESKGRPPAKKNTKNEQDTCCMGFQTFRVEPNRKSFLCVERCADISVCIYFLQTCLDIIQASADPSAAGQDVPSANFRGTCGSLFASANLPRRMVHKICFLEYWQTGKSF